MRGKHAASAAKRRADSAEDQLDRLMEEVTDLRRKVKQYKSAFDILPSLQAQLRDIKREAGVPRSQVDEMIAAHHSELESVGTAYEDDLLRILTAIEERTTPRYPYESQPSLHLADCRSLRNMPEKAANLCLAIVGVRDRDTRRLMLSDFERTIKDESGEWDNASRSMQIVNKWLGGDPKANIYNPPSKHEVFNEGRSDDDA